MSEYKMSQYELQSYFKSLCNSFYIAYDQVKRLEKEKRENDTKYKEIGAIVDKWQNHMWNVYEEIEEVIYEIYDNKFTVIVTTKAELYVLMNFYASWDHPVKKYPIVNMNEEYRKEFPIGEQICEDFLYAYEQDMKCVVSTHMDRMCNKYF